MGELGAGAAVGGVMQPGWRRCSKCAAMWWINNLGADTCPAGGTHEAAMSGVAQYAIGYQPPPVPASPAAWAPWQDQWAWCSACGELWYAGYTSQRQLGVCPKNGTTGHTSAGSASYWIVLDDDTRWGDASWLWCTACFALVGNGGACPAAAPHGPHKPGPGAYTVYVLPTTPVACPNLLGGPDRAQSLLNTFTPTLYLAAGEESFPSEVEWYLSRVTMTFAAEVSPTDPDSPSRYVYEFRELLSTVADSNMADQVQRDRWIHAHRSGLSPCNVTTGTREPQYLLQVDNPAATYPGWSATSNGALTQPPPVYGAVIDNPTTGTIDLLYSFFYPFNGESMNGIWGIWTHEADWEHVIVRLDPDGSNILGVFMQAHRSGDPYSRWYSPPGTQNQPCFQLEGSSVQVFSSQGGHGSYPGAGSFPYGMRGNDITSDTYRWNPLWVVMVDPCSQAYTRYTGSWGGWLNATWDWPPAGPLFQEWLRPRQDGPRPDDLATVDIPEQSVLDRNPELAGSSG